MEWQNKAKTINKDQRRQIIMEYPETTLHGFLKELFQAMEPNYVVEITHGPNELGKDLVIVKSDNFTQEVIGVVVKRGDIKARTLGDVDNLKGRVKSELSAGVQKRLEEIKSQIEQALTHSAEMKSSLKNLSVSKVFVVLAGEFSNQARRRLTKELASEIEIFDISWLVDSFTEFYPQIFFEGRVIDFIEKKIQELERNHWLEKSNKNLSDYFVEPLVMTLNFDNFDEFDEKKIRKIWKQKKLPFLRLGELCKRERKLILLGDPGTGKTGAMAKLAIDMYNKAYPLLSKKPGKSKPKIPVPVFVSARKLLEAESAECFLKAYFESEEVADRFDVNVMMVDGLDEIESENRQAVISKLDKFSEAADCSYILTSRKIDIINTLPGKYKKYELLPFEFNQALQLFSKLISDNKVLNTMRDGLEKIQSQILLVPLSLMLLIELVETHKEIPASVTELYDRFFDRALGREDEEKGIEVLFNYLIKKKFLGELAYREFWNKNRLEIPDEDFKHFLDSYAHQYGWSTEDFNGFVQEIERAGILDQREKVNFKHRSFLDYFAAFYIYENRGDIQDLNDLIVRTYFDSLWSEVSFFYIGLRREINQDLLDRIYSYKDDKDDKNETLPVILDKLLSGRLLQAGWHSPTQRHIDGIKNAINHAPRFHERFQKIITSSSSDIPNIISDFVVLTLADLSFNSAFLERHIKTILKQLVTSNSRDDIYMAVVLSWSICRFLNPSEIKENTNNILDKLVDLSTKEQARILLLMTLTEEQDKETRKLISQKINRIKKRSPQAFKALLPAKRKGFR